MKTKPILLIVVLSTALGGAVAAREPLLALNAAFSGKLWIVGGVFFLLAVFAVTDWVLAAPGPDTVAVRRRKAAPAPVAVSRSLSFLTRSSVAAAVGRRTRRRAERPASLRKI